MKDRKWSGVARRKAHAAQGALRAASKPGGQWYPVIAGLRFSRESIDALSLGREATLSESKWIPYRYMTAFECTELFAREYVAAFRTALGKHKDHARAERSAPGHEQLALNSPGEISSLWKARQQADELGVTYSFFLRVAMEAALEARAYAHVPRPNQLCLPWQIKAVQVEWERVSETRGLFEDDWDPRFFSEHFRNDPPQRAAHAALVKRIMDRPEDRRALALSNYVGRAIPVAEAERLFTPALVAEAAAIKSTPAAIVTGQPPLHYVPPCIGLRRFTAPVACVGCRYAPVCDGVAAQTDEALMRATGSTTPREDGVRAENNRRKREQRERDRLKRDATPGQTLS